MCPALKRNALPSTDDPNRTLTDESRTVVCASGLPLEQQRVRASGKIGSEWEASRPTGGVWMRKVVAFQFVSLDGVAERPDRFVTDWDDVLDASGVELIATQDAVTLGRRTYDE
jgi:hypothetical protein